MSSVLSPTSDQDIAKAGSSLEVFGNQIGANTLGILWRAASGTVDPWTKALIVSEATPGTANSDFGEAMTPEVLQAVTGKTVEQYQAEQENLVTQQLTEAGADPSQFSDGVNKSLKKIKDVAGSLIGAEMATLLLIAGVGIVVLVVVNRLERV